ncbi:MAG: hypothetical protein Q9184_007643 [Pyrenodesmia sp. 2 TL-2023]
MGREEQIEEREVLDSIFPDEIQDINETSYRVAIKPDIPHETGVEDAETPTLLLTVTYPPVYPDEPPILDLSLPLNAPKPQYLDLASDRLHLLSSLNDTITENLGMAMIFTLVTTLQESIETLIRSRIAEVQRAKDEEAAEAEVKENAKFEGERVTRESFLKWREKFRAEMAMKEEEEERVRREGESKVRGVRKEEKMSGRELWEKGLVGKEVEEEEGVGLEEGLEGLKVG